MTLVVPDLEHFAAFCSTLTLPNGQRMELEPFQRLMLADYYDRGAQETLAIVPKKNGKTTLAAAVLLHHLIYVDEAEAYVVAQSVKQAGKLYREAKGFVRKSPALQRRVLVREGTKEFRSRRDGGTAQVLAADSDTADGVGPTLALVDELHRAKSLALYEVLRDGLDGRDGSMFAITTPAEDEEGPLGQIRSKALGSPTVKRKGRYTYTRSADGSFVMHEYGLRPDDDDQDLDLVKSVNPLKSMTKAKLRRVRDSHSTTRHAWRRFRCGMWAQDDEAAIADVDWAKIVAPGCRLKDGFDSDVVIGIDLGWTSDTSALVPIGHQPGNRDLAFIDERLKVIYPPGGGEMLDEEQIKGPLREWGHHETGVWPACRFALDPNAGGQSLYQWIVRELCAGDETRVQAVSQQPASMQECSMHFSDGIRAPRVEEPPEGEENEDAPRTVPVRHPDSPDLNRHARAAVARYNGERWRFDKRKVATGSTQAQARPIDSIVAATLGYRVLTAPAELVLEPFVMVG